MVSEIVPAKIVDGSLLQDALPGRLDARETSTVVAWENPIRQLGAGSPMLQCTQRLVIQRHLPSSATLSIVSTNHNLPLNQINVSPSKLQRLSSPKSRIECQQRHGLQIIGKHSC